MRVLLAALGLLFLGALRAFPQGCSRHSSAHRGLLTAGSSVSLTTTWMRPTAVQPA
ncbi:TNFRSF8 isoform 5 [Pan troglodytes]|uniref:TNF receptor superfamily member 8 n=2 Tax=Homininae TaxID=207598 RepID=D6RAG8_HUMAN|nr:TNF receptor superfamily member 8 [Homo sapiens]KAI4078685.1 TNF receptor superfamily member 8 [Homo sapiens]PNI39635.1 TNFRSF8 isoform 5 [Pan troglodytes]